MHHWLKPDCACMPLQIQIVSESNASEVLFDVAPNSWVHKAQGHRTFFADGLAYLPSETPPALQEWRQAELDEMKVRLGHMAFVWMHPLC